MIHVHAEVEKNINIATVDKFSCYIYSHGHNPND